MFDSRSCPSVGWCKCCHLRPEDDPGFLLRSQGFPGNFHFVLYDFPLKTNYKYFNFHKCVSFVLLFIIESKVALGMRALSRPNVFQFHAVFGWKCQNNRLAQPAIGLAHPAWIPDPPLRLKLHVVCTTIMSCHEIPIILIKIFRSRMKFVIFGMVVMKVMKEKVENLWCIRLVD